MFSVDGADELQRRLWAPAIPDRPGGTGRSGERRLAGPPGWLGRFIVGELRSCHTYSPGMEHGIHPSPGTARPTLSLWSCPPLHPQCARSASARESFPETRLLAITGPGTAFGDGIGPPIAVKDAPPATILVVETASSGIPWPAPGDFDIRSMPRTVCSYDGKGISSQHAGGFHVIFADEYVWLFPTKFLRVLSKFFTTVEAGTHNREQLLGPFTFASRTMTL